MRRVIVAALGLALLAGGCGDIDPEELLAETDPPSTPAVDGDEGDDEDGDESGADDDRPGAGGATTTTTDDAPADDPPADGGPPGATGTLEAPIAPGEVADIGNGWRVQVRNVVPDGTDAVMNENQFNDPPPADRVFTLVSVAIGYYGDDDPIGLSQLGISAVANQVEIDEGCGVIPDDIPFADIYAGGVVTGNVCFVTDGSVDGLVLTVEEFFTLDDQRAFLALGPAGRTPLLPTLPGPQPGAASTPARLDPVPAGKPTAVGDSWTVTIENGRVGTADVLAENQFNDPPPPGSVFYLVDVTLTYDGPESGQRFDVGLVAVDDRNIVDPNDCGVVPGGFDFSLEVFPGGTLAGTDCFIVPEDQVDAVRIGARELFVLDAPLAFFAPA